MKAVLLNKTGKPDILTITEVADPVAGPGEVLVRMIYTGINYAEVLSRKGLYGWSVNRPYILGMEGSGVVESVGEGVSQSRVGQEVMVGTQFGCYAEQVAVPEERAIPFIPHLNKEENAAFLVNFMTAWISLFSLARLKPEDRVLITAAAGGVGTAAVQLAVAQGCKVYGFAGSDEKFSLLKSLRVTDAFNYRKSGYLEELKSKSGGIDVVLEMVGGNVFRKSFQLLNPFGRLVVAGFASLDLNKLNPLSWWKTWRDIPRVKLGDLAQKTGSVSATHLGYLLKDPQKMMAIFNDLKNYTTAHKIRPIIGKIFDFDQVVEAHAFLESRKSVGKVLLRHNR